MTMTAPRTEAVCPEPVSSPQLSEFTEKLTVPARIDLRDGGTAALRMRSGAHRFHADLPPTPTSGYAPEGSTGADWNGGPTIEARRGVPARLVVRNALGPHPLADSMDHTLMGMTGTDGSAPRGVIHLHGAHSEPSQDGLPTDTVVPGERTTYRYVNDQEATGLWYHDHSWGMTRLQVVAGLAGQYWLRDGFDTGQPDNMLGLPSGDAEIPLTLQDRTFAADGTFAYPAGPFCGNADVPDGYPNQWAPEFFGDVAVVNGKVTPNLDVARGMYRFRLLNASNARFYHVVLPTGLTVYQIGGDGGLLNAPVRLTELLIAPAERMDLLVDLRKATPGRRFVLRNDANSPFGTLDAPPDEDEAPLHDLMQLTVTSKVGLQNDVPRTLRGGRNRPPTLPTLRPSRTRSIMLNEIADPSVDEPVHGHINNQFYADTDGTPRISEIENPALNSVETWEIVNATGDAHPIHLHMTQFRVLDRQGFDVDAYTSAVNAALPPDSQLPDPAAAGRGPWPGLSPQDFLQGKARNPAPGERGWKDVVMAPPGMVTRIVVPFGGTAAGVPAPFTGDAPGVAVQRFAGTYVFHCHILEHEDNDMMQPYRIG
ncbi:MAG TPA: multicopper oxidase domain-containing protein [Nocardioides sp.]|uniref:multicopper oxidase family protein n=1 Tax=Nocardioides sp. TaxID=35761 RepID=UPI002D7F8861|nr:multicopper oxidase domain-containing protein [Nocardioides sp.]HET6652299.1 multicopper oxidase domain-containing protein [Nocardioides sp.]